MPKRIDALEHLAKLQDLVDLAEFMDDDDLAEAMDLAMKCVANPNISVATAQKTLVKMEAYSFQFKLRALKLMAIDQPKSPSEAYRMKSVYMSVSEKCHDLAQTLKYIARDAAL